MDGVCQQAWDVAFGLYFWCEENGPMERRAALCQRLIPVAHSTVGLNETFFLF